MWQFRYHTERHSEIQPIWSQIENPQFWSQTATVTWCEPKYAITPYISEFWNTATSLPFILLAIVGRNRTGGQRPSLQFGYASLLLTGIGTGLFHCTGLFWTQLADELPMYCLALSFIHALEDTHPLFRANTLGWIAVHVMMWALVVFGIVAYLKYRIRSLPRP